jgi:hypothetical protein
MVTFLYIVIVFLLVFANGFFVASEFALVGVRGSRVQTLAESGSPKARRLLHLLDNLNAYISATQLGITMASLALGWIGEPVFAHLLEAPLKDRVSEVTLHTISFAIAFTVITFLHIVLGELAPKTLALERAFRGENLIQNPILDQGPNTINRENVQRRIIVQANVADRDLGSVIADVRTAIGQRVRLPQGYFVQYGGQFESQEKHRARSFCSRLSPSQGSFSCCTSH